MFSPTMERFGKVRQGAYLPLPRDLEIPPDRAKLVTEIVVSHARKLASKFRWAWNGSRAFMIPELD